MDDRIRACFPHTSFRPGQLEFIREAVQAFEGGAKNVIVEAPTGTGKTAGAITIAKYFTPKHEEMSKDMVVLRGMAVRASQDERRQAQEHLAPHSAHMITSMKMLQDQYLKDDPLVQLMRGKGNYKCHHGSVQPGMSCGDHEAVFGHPCKSRNPCIYTAERTKAQLARLTLHNFDSFLNQASLGGSFLPRAILTIDEAHNTDDHLIRAMTFELSETIVDKLGLIEEGWMWEPPSRGDDTTRLVCWLQVGELKMKKLKEKLAEKLTNMREINRYMGTQELREMAGISKQTKSIDELLRKISRFVKSHHMPWSVTHDDVNKVIRFEPVISAPFAKSALLGFGEKRLCTSATVFDEGRRLMTALALKKEETHYIAVKCIFPVSNRPLVAAAVADTGQAAYERNKESVMQAVSHLLLVHNQERGVIHCNSYRMAEDIKRSILDPRLLFHGAKDRENVVNYFMSQGRPNQVLVGVFLREGYDFKDDIARFQILMRLPFTTPDNRINMRKEIEPGYYDWLAAIDLVQTYGRGVRNENDRCITYCLDSRLAKFLKRTSYMLPSWFLEAVCPPEAVGMTFQRAAPRLATEEDNADIWFS